MKVDLKGAVCVCVGRIAKATRRDLETAVTKMGVITAASVTSKTSYVIVGKSPGSQYIKAKNMGVPCLTEDDFKALVSGDFVEVGGAGDRNVDELLGEVRSVMQGAPHAKMWSALVTLLDACRARDVHVLTEYIDGYITRWTTESMKGLSGSSFALADDKKDPRMRWLNDSQRGVGGELRVAPEHWVGEMQQGVESPKFKVVRALELTSAKITSTAVAKIIAHPSLTHLETLELPESLVPSKSLIRVICEHETLEHLKLGRVDEKTCPAFVALGTKPRQLTRLDLSAVNSVSRLRHRQHVICQFINVPFFSTVKTLHLSGVSYYEDMFFEQMAKHNALPQVDHLRFDRSYSVEFIADVLQSPWAAATLKRLTSRALYIHPSSEKNWRKVFAIDFEGHLDLLDLSGFVSEWQVEDPEQELARMLAEQLPTSRLIGHVSTLVLGTWKTPELCEAILAQHPDMQML